MAFIPISSGEIATGEPVSNTTQTKIQENFDNHESRILAVENGNTTVYPPIVMRMNGRYDTLNATDGVLVTTANFNLTITGIFLICEIAGASGTTEIDIEYKRGAGAWTSVLATPPSLTHSAGDYAQSSNAVLDFANVDLQAGDFIRLNLNSAQVAGRNFIARIDFSKT